ncbi:MAG: uracil-DNA glycosylase [bacterium]|nr:uracil-DNA glycosylase [bacterium]
MTTPEFERLQEALVECRRCPRLVAWREEVGVSKRAAFADHDYWARPVPMLGLPSARLLIIGLAPGAHGSNRTGRMFTGDRSGEWLFRSLYRAGFANRPDAISRGDGFELRDAAITAIVRCVPPRNRPLPKERDTCAEWINRELDLCRRVRVIVALGGMAFDQTLRLGIGRGWRVARPRPRFAHGIEVDLGPDAPALIGCYHPSQQNTFTGRLTEEMLDAVFGRAARLLRDS